ncbi:hypothetical protein QTP70_018730, partial [Hemibagrus guttatus]
VHCSVGLRPWPSAWVALPPLTFLCSSADAIYKLFGRHARKKPFLTYNHKCKRLEFAKQYWDFNWDRVLWSDETQIELFGNKHSKWVWCKTKDEYAEKHLMPTVKYSGGSVMLWDCFSSKGPGNLVSIMGNLLKVLTCSDLDEEPNFFLDFENAQPTDAERETWKQVDGVLMDARAILDELQAYNGAGKEIREAIQNPNDEALQDQAWAAVVPLVGKLKKFYEFSQRLEAALHSLLRALTNETYSDATQHLEREQALAKQFAEILHFTLRFDELKMTNPAIQNDFSYYRRTLNRMRINNVPAEGENEVNNELANRISLFYADATPMLKTLSDGTTKFVSENKNLPIENTTDVLSTMASVCKVMLETPEYRSRFSSEATVSFCLRVMVGVIILYDYVHPVGAFAKSSKIDMKGCIKVLREQPPNSVEGLLNALRYTTKHLNDESTAKTIRSMLQ